MKVSLSALAYLFASASIAALAKPISLDYTKRAQQDAHIVARSLQTDPVSFAVTNFTHLVIGGGTAGVAVAVRLSEVATNVVGIIEAGSDGSSNPINTIPGCFGANLGTVYDWNYTTSASSAGAPSIHWPRGKVLGGSSVLNFLLWDRAASIEYDAWEDLGSKGWNWNNLFKYMKKAETFTAPSSANAKALDITPNASNYGSSGPLQVSYPKYISSQVSKWIPALQALGIAKNDEPLGGNNVGASNQPSDINPSNSARASSAAAYFAPASGRKNLKVLVNALATKIEFASGNSARKTATGVTFTSGGKSYTANTCEKVIVSGGTVNTPAILELSGIGNKDILSKAGITTLVDNANVGENLQDHVYSQAAYALVPGINTLDSLRNNATYAAQQMALYKANKPSILDETVPSIGYITLKQLVGSANATKLTAEAASYVKTQSSKPYYATLQKQLEYLQKYPNQVGQMEVIGVDGYFAGSGAPLSNTTYVTFLAAQQHMFSRGTIHISSSDATVYPTIQPNYFNAPYDLDVLTAGTSFLRKIAEASPYAKNYISKEVVPGNVDLRSYTLNTFTTEYHPVGTASMLPKSKGGVVNSKLRVYGTHNVHVVDASVIPVHISAHIQATIYGIAEAAADILKGKTLS